MVIKFIVTFVVELCQNTMKDSNEQFGTSGFLIMGLNFIIISVMFVMIWQC